MSENERILDDRPDKIGSPLDQKIDKKVSHTVFFSVIGGMSLIALFIFGILFTQIGGLNDKVNALQTDVAVTKDRLGSKKNY